MAIKLELRKKGNSYYFSNPKTDSENELHNDKISGAKVLLELLDSKIISNKNALELFAQICEDEDIPMLVIGSDPGTKLDECIELIKLIENQLREEFGSLPQEELPYFSICRNCGNHGSFIGKNFSTEEFYSKYTCLSYIKLLHRSAKINDEERKKLEAQVRASKLPYTKRAVNPTLN